MIVEPKQPAFGHVPPLKQSYASEAWLTFGVGARVVNYLGALVVGGCWVATWDWSIFDVPAAQVTMRLSTMHLARIGAALALAFVWFRFAFAFVFNERPISYDLWPWFGVMEIAGMFLWAWRHS